MLCSQAVEIEGFKKVEDIIIDFLKTYICSENDKFNIFLEVLRIMLNRFRVIYVYTKLPEDQIFFLALIASRLEYCKTQVVQLFKL
jgi:hypothetical protein